MRFSHLLAAAAVSFALIGGAQAERLTDEPLVDTAWLQQHLDNDSLVILDVRDAVEGVQPYATGHIPGAISAPYATSGWRQEIQGIPAQFPGEQAAAQLIGNLGISNDDHVVIVSQGTNASEFGAATRVYWTFKVLGHDAVSILNGGVRGWEAAGGELTADASVLSPTTFTSSFRSELLASTADVEVARADGVPLIDGRPPAQFRGEAKAPVARVPGTIPGSVNLDNNLFYDAENASFANAEQIAELARSIGLDGDDANIAFCNTGHWASIVWFGLHEVQGNTNTRMYDGSMAEWTADPARPVENGV
jgi:thiosulfate/3-mercaptopyruvate sulfurtransferase